MTCARDGCNKPVLKTAVLHGDRYCSSVCFRIDHGTMTADTAATLAAASDKGRIASRRWRDQANASWKHSGRVRSTA